MADFITAESHETRLRAAVSAAWAVFSRKVGGGLIPVNKEASMQLQYAYILQQILPLAAHDLTEHAEIELETGVSIAGRSNEIDVLIKGRSGSSRYKIAVEMKCYRERTSSDKKRGAQDIFMKDVYDDLAILEQYVKQGAADHAVALVMTDHERFVNPRKRKHDAKCWDYNIANGTIAAPGEFNTPIGGKAVSFTLEKSYSFRWTQFGNFWFMELEGQTLP